MLSLLYNGSSRFTRRKNNVKSTQEQLTKALLQSYGIDMSKAGTKDTARRMCTSLFELTSTERDIDINTINDPTKLLEHLKARGMGAVFTENVPTRYQRTVTQKDITFHSLCEHHMLPFFGKAEVEYIPCGSVIGLSKIARIVEYFSKMPQLQERLALYIAEGIVAVTNTNYVSVRLYDVRHMCMEMRGVECDAQTDVRIVFDRR